MQCSSLRRLLGLAAVCFSAWASAALTPGLSQKLYSTSAVGDPVLEADRTVVPGALFACTGPWSGRWSGLQYTVDGATYTMSWVNECWVYSGFWYMKGGTEYHFARQYGYGAYLSFEITPESSATKTIFGKGSGLATASFTPKADGWCQVRIELASDSGYNCGPSEEPFISVQAGLLWNDEPGLVECTAENVGSWKKFINTEDETFLYVGVPGIKVESEVSLVGIDGLGIGWQHGLEEGQSYTFSMSKYATNTTYSAVYKCSGWTLTARDGTSTSGNGNKATFVYDSSLENAQLVWNWTEHATLSPGMKYGTSVADDMDFTPTDKVVSSTGLAFAGNSQWGGIQYGEQVLGIGTAAYQFWMDLRKGASYNIAGSFNDYYRVRITDPDGVTTTLSSSPATYVPTQSGWHQFDIRFSNAAYGSVGCFTEPYLTARRALVWNVDGPTEVTAENITTEWYRFANEDFEEPLFWAEIPPAVGGPAGTVLYLR